MAQVQTPSRAWTWGAVVLLFVYWFARLHHLLTLPIFLDEASHITRAQWVWEGKPFYLLETGKALAPYLAALFWPFTAAPFIGRFVVVLIGIVGIASAYAVGRELHSRQAGLLTMTLWIICPQLIFFERMALVDTTISSMAMLALWLALCMLRRPRMRTAILCGGALALCVFAKTTGVVFLPIPILVALLIKLPTPWLTRARQIGVAYVVAALLLVGPFLYVESVNADPTGLAYGLTTTRTDNLLERVQANAAKVWAAEQVYYTKPMLWVILVAGVFALFYATRPALVLLALIAALLAAIIAAAASLWLRYASPAAPFILLLAAIGLLTFVAELRKLRLPRLVYALPWLIATIWGALAGIPFHLTAYSNPTQLPLPDGDVVEYIQWIPSGYGIQDAARYLQQFATTPITVVGTAVNCNAARLYLPLDTPIKMICPDLDWGGGNWNVVAEIQQLADADGSVYVLGEDVPIVREDQLPERHTIIKEFNRPAGRFTVKLYRVSGPSSP